MANSPAVLAAYAALRAALAEQSSFDPKTGSALTLATAAAVGDHYMIAITSRLAQMSGWAQDQVAALHHEVQRVRSHPLIPASTAIGGFVYDVETGLIDQLI